MKPDTEKCAKVLACYLGSRRKYPLNKEQSLAVLDVQIHLHKRLAPGFFTDLILVNHNLAEEEDPELSKYDGLEIKEGTVKVLNRPFIYPDLSFGSYKYAYHKFRDQYKYWFFCEDDIVPLQNGIVEDMIELLTDEVGFVGALNLGHGHKYNLEDGYIKSTAHNEKPSHIHGGVGLTSAEKIEQVIRQNPDFLQTPNIIQDALNPLPKSVEEKYNQGLEIEFTNVFVRSGFKLKYLDSIGKFLRLQNAELC